VFTYKYNAAGRMVSAVGVTSTLVYTYSPDGLRVAQSVESSESVFSWDWATGVPELLSDGEALYLVGHDTLGWTDGATWRYTLPDALGSIRQTVDAAGAVVSVREWTPYGVEVGAAQAGLGYTGEWYDAALKQVYLRARWLDVATGRFTQRDQWEGTQEQPATMNAYIYVLANPVNTIDPTGYCPNREGIERGDYSYSCNCGWIDWKHASPRTAKQFLTRVFAEIDDRPYCSSKYKAIEVSMRDAAGGISRYVVVRRNMDIQEKKEVALGIFKEMSEEFETYQGSAFGGLGEALFHSSFAEEDLPSNLIGFYVALDLAEDPNMQTFEDITGPELQEMVRPICDAPLDDRSDISWSLKVWDESYVCEKNRTWCPRLVSSCEIDSRCGLLSARRWPEKYGSIHSELPIVGGKWWWYRGHTIDGGLLASDVPRVYHLWSPHGPPSFFTP
jgi:RHS repeat-associated protein